MAVTISFAKQTPKNKFKKSHPETFIEKRRGTVSVQNHICDFHTDSSPLPQSSIPRDLRDVATQALFQRLLSRSWHTWLALT